MDLNDDTVIGKGCGMKKTWMHGLMILVGIFFISSCDTNNGAVLPTPSPSASPQPTVVKSLPTPAAPGQGIIYSDLQVEMTQAEITTSYLNEYGSTREPSAGMEILWVHIDLKNIGQSEQELPAPEHFSALNGAIEFKPIYGHRKDHPDYLALATILVPGQSVDAWLRFDIPAGLDQKDLWFVFMPESTVVSVGFSPTDFFWGDLPIYLWKCAP